MSAKINITQQDVIDNENLRNKAIFKLWREVDFDAEDFSHAEVQWALTNDRSITGIALYSPVLTENQMNADVPVAWPSSSVLDEDGEVVRQKTFFEYTQWHTVNGGYCIKFSNGPASENKNISLPTYAQLKVWVTKVGGFLTEAEFNAIKVVNEGP